MSKKKVVRSGSKGIRIAMLPAASPNVRSCEEDELRSLITEYFTANHVTCPKHGRALKSLSFDFRRQETVVTAHACCPTSHPTIERAIHELRGGVAASEARAKGKSVIAPAPKPAAVHSIVREGTRIETFTLESVLEEAQRKEAAGVPEVWLKVPRCRGHPERREDAPGVFDGKERWGRAGGRSPRSSRRKRFVSARSGTGRSEGSPRIWI